MEKGRLTDSRNEGMRQPGIPPGALLVGELLNWWEKSRVDLEARAG